jgi:hypothetical protein
MLAVLVVAHASSGAQVQQSDIALAESLSRYPDARCLDGSAGMYYFRPGWGDGLRKFHFHQMGGGFCTSVEDCYHRAKDCERGLGSSKCWPSTYNLTSDGGPYFSPNQTANPLLYNWNRVYMVYCDGAYFSGANNTETLFNGTALYFKGAHVLKATVADVAAKHGLVDATDVIIGGCSAGGIATYAHLDQFASLVHSSGSTSRIGGFADSGYYLDVDYYTNQKRFVTDYQNVTALLSPACLRDYPAMPHKCLIADINARYLRTPLFAWQSKYDADQLSGSISPPCTTGVCATPYGANLSSSMHRSLFSSVPAIHGDAWRKRGGSVPVVHGAFIDGCHRHCQYWGKISLVQSMSPLQALHMWYTAAQPQFTHLALEQDAPAYPCSNCCAAP